MTEKGLCGVCNKNEMAFNCTECGIPLCEICAKEVLIQEMTPAARWKPDVTGSPSRPGQFKKKVCPKCMKEVDFYA